LKRVEEIANKTFDIEVLQSAFLIEKKPYCPYKDVCFQYKQETVERGKGLSQIAVQLFHSIGSKEFPSNLERFQVKWTEYHRALTQDREDGFQSCEKYLNSHQL